MTCELFFFFFNDTATTEIYTLSLHDALPIWIRSRRRRALYMISASILFALAWRNAFRRASRNAFRHARANKRSEEHTSELQSRSDLVCRLLLEKKKKNKTCSSISHSITTIIS